MIDLKPDAFRGDPVGRFSNQAGHMRLAFTLAYIQADIGVPIVAAAWMLAAYLMLEVYQLFFMGGEVVDSGFDMLYFVFGFIEAYLIASFVPQYVDWTIYGICAFLFAHSAFAELEAD